MTLVSSSSVSRASSGGSGIPARGHSTRDRARRRVDTARSYGPLLRAADNFHAWVDKRRAPAVDVSDQPWTRRQQSTLDENSRRVLAGVRDVLAPVLVRLDASRARLVDLDASIALLENRLGEVTADQGGPGFAETHLPTEAVTVRAERRAAERRRAISTERDAAVAERRGLQRAIAADEAIVREEFDMAATIARRWRDFHQRRLHTYARRFLGVRDDAVGLHHNLDLPSWVELPCPWLPAPEPTDSAAVRTLHAV